MSAPQGDAQGAQTPSGKKDGWWDSAWDTFTLPGRKTIELAENAGKAAAQVPGKLGGAALGAVENATDYTFDNLIGLPKGEDGSRLPKDPFGIGKAADNLGDVATVYIIASAVGVVVLAYIFRQPIANALKSVTP